MQMSVWTSHHVATLVQQQHDCREEKHLPAFRSSQLAPALRVNQLQERPAAAAQQPWPVLDSCGVHPALPVALRRRLCRQGHHLHWQLLPEVARRQEEW